MLVHQRVHHIFGVMHGDAFLSAAGLEHHVTPFDSPVAGDIVLKEVTSFLRYLQKAIRRLSKGDLNGFFQGI